MAPRLHYSSLATATLLLLLTFPLEVIGTIPGISGTQVQAQTVQDRKAEADRLILQGDRHLVAGQYVLAADAFEQSLRIYREIQDFQGEQMTVDRLYLIYAYLVVPDKWVQLANQSSFHDDDSITSAEALFAQALQQLRLENYSGAIAYLEQLLKINREAQDFENMALCLQMLGGAYLNQENYNQAITYFEQSVQITREIEGFSQGKLALLSLGETYFQQGDNRQAIEYFEQALMGAQENQNASSIPLPLMSLGKVYLNLGDYPKAVAYAQQAVTAYQQASANVQEESDPSVERQIPSKALALLGEALFKSGKLVEAEETLLAAIKAFETERKLANSYFVSDLESVQQFEGQVDIAQPLQQVFIAQNKTQAALEASEWGRARVTVELLSKQLSSPKSSQTLAQRFCQQQVDSASLFSLGLSPIQAQEVVEHWIQECWQVQSSIQQSIQQSQPLQTEQLNWLLAANVAIQAKPLTINPPTVQQIKQVAQEQKATLVEYSIIYDKTYGKLQGKEQKLLIWVVKPTGEGAFEQVDLQSLNTSLEDLVTNSRKSMGISGRGLGVSFEPRLDQSDHLKQLHKLLIEPIVQNLPNDPNERVIFIPQNELFLVPFPALQDASGKYLIQKHTILTAPSIQVLQLTHEKRPTVSGDGVLVVGNPTMPSVTTKVGEASQQLTNLPGAEKEATEIAQLLKTQALIGNQATKAAILPKLSNARIIHLATHGLLDDFKGLGVPGAIALAPNGTGELNDGLLTASEILDLDLNAELVVLSACDTGRGRITGDGVIGLSRSLITAGVPSVIVSLWLVPDASTTSLMTQFYQNLQTNPDKAQALRQAMLTTMETRRNPRDWAAFTLIGEAQ